MHVVMEKNTPQNEFKRYALRNEFQYKVSRCTRRRCIQVQNYEAMFLFFVIVANAALCQKQVYLVLCLF